MSLIPWAHKRAERDTELLPVAGLRNEVDRLFDSFFRDPWAGFERAMAGDLTPTIDLHDDPTGVTVTAELPGVKPADIELSVTGNLLTIAGHKEERKESQQGGYVHQERRFGSFRRDVVLPAPVDASNVDAKFDHGVLTVRLNKTAEAIARKIPISG